MFQVWTNVPHRGSGRLCPVQSFDAWHPSAAACRPRAANSNALSRLRHITQKRISQKYVAAGNIDFHYITLIQGRNRKFEKMNQILYSILILRILIDPKWAWLSYSTGQRVSGRWSLFWLRPSSLVWLNPIATRESLLGNHKLCSIFHIMFI